MILRRTAERAAVRETEWVVVRAAFTLMEMLVVVAIIVALAGLGGYYFLGQLNESKKKTALIQVKTTLSQAVDTFHIQHSRFPQSLQELMVRDGGAAIINNSDALIDPWGNPYQYNPNAQNPETGDLQPEIWTTSPDGVRISNLGPQQRMR